MSSQASKGKGMGKRTMHSFFSKIEIPSSAPDVIPDAGIPASNVDNPTLPIHVEERPSKSQRVDFEEFDPSKVERDPGKHLQICQYHHDKQDEVRRAYLKLGANHHYRKDYPRTAVGKQFRRFQHSWFIQFPWLEYSDAKDKAFCFPCFIFETNPPKRPQFTIDGFSSWKRVSDRKYCAFLAHEGVTCSH